MKRPILRGILLTMAALFMVTWPLMTQMAHGAETNSKYSPEELVAMLQKGGYNIFLRHGATDRRQRDSIIPNLKKCSTQRNLSDAGRQHMRALGKRFKDLKIPVSEVQSSPFCRCAESGRLAFGEVIIRNDLRSAPDHGGPEGKLLAQTLRRLLGQMPPQGSNSVLISHTTNLYMATRIWPRYEGIAMIFHPTSNGGFRYLGSIMLNQWPKPSRQDPPEGS